MKKLLKTVLKILLVLIVLGAGGLAYLISQNAWPINIPLGLIFGAEVDEEALDQSLVLPDGYAWSVYATGIGKTRMLLALPGGKLLVSTPDVGAIKVLGPDENGDGKADTVATLLDGLSRPTGLAFHDGYLYIGEDNAIGRAKLDPVSSAPGAYERIVTGLTAEGNHWTKTIDIGPDGKLHMSSGSTCNVCEEEDERRAAMMKFELDGSNGRIIATGLRNSVGFDWAPDGALYATENSRDLLGDDFPPEELNRIEEGNFYGWPYVNGFGDLDPDFGPGHEVELDRAISPVHGFRPHNAPLGITFIGGPGVLADYQNAALVALHGSWNRSEKDGYKVVSLHFNDGKIEERDFMTGFLKDGKVIGRPVDVEQDEAGNIFVSDDMTQTVYKLTLGIQEDIVLSGQASSATDGEGSGEAPEVFGEEAVAAGRRLYDENGCTSCHGEDVEGGIHFQNLSERYNAAGIIEVLEFPQPPMPTYDLTDDEKQALAAFLLTEYK